ncbi:glycoside hydrolase family 31 protein [Oceanivirga miroungae]|uniref:Oligosaccharide 4-alpha-D-glucosyltransferase n=1 Tax=Oceanivirga miroungae TaxID=1130046 RepID=A0A6I8MF87_9FUSO|nr:TIM-barrel domain-containing protein [Oceanivirga miroungae]VWL85957.1 Oligosaccharide 4-alpha-D-glucosyltransferase [Oceanivirga miroungae]
MIKKYRIGNPIETFAVLKELKIEKELPEYIKIVDNKINISLNDSDIVYGLGQAVRGINKRGYKYISNTSDDPVHTEDKGSLYAAHNYIMIDSFKKFGIFIDTPSKVTFDLGYTDINKIEISFEYNDYDLYLIEASSLVDILKEFRELIGKSYLPPKWAFGYGQSRWSYFNKEEVKEVVKKHRENNIPLDMVYLDIDYMKDYKDFTIDNEKFSDFESFVKEMKKENIRLIPIIDAGVKIEKGYDVYEEGVKNSYFLTKENGDNIVCGVWPGDVHFPDFLNENVREWFGKKYQFLIDKGIEGFWNDMNEPAIFYTKDRLNEVLDKITEYKGTNLDIHKFFEFKDRVLTLSNNNEDYKLMYHNYLGKRYRHDIVHNLYGYNMTKAAGEYFNKINKEILMFSRSSYIGAHRYGGIWQGDNSSWWSHLKLNMDMSVNLNMIGFIFNGADLGGFGSNCTPDLMQRWLQFGIFTPLMRNHSALGTRRQEVYEFSNMEKLRDIIEFRYSILDYIYDETKKAVENNTMYLRPLAFDYEKDLLTREITDQILVGDSIMIAPIYEQNKKGRYVYLPEDMKMLKVKSKNDIKEEVLKKGHHYIEVNLDEFLIFVRKGKTFTLKNGGQSVDSMDSSIFREF